MAKEKIRLVPTPAAGGIPLSGINIGINSDPLPMPVRPISNPTTIPIWILPRRCKIGSLDVTELHQPGADFLALFVRVHGLWRRGQESPLLE